MRAWFSLRSPSLLLTLSWIAAGLSVMALAVPASSAALATPRVMKAALASASGQTVGDRCAGADLRAFDGPLFASRVEARNGDTTHAMSRQPTLNRALPANDDLARFSRAF
jgi:hypothetical protein